MIRLLSLPLLAAALLLGAPSLRAQAPRIHFVDALAEGQKQKIVVYGTSLTANAEWPALLQKELTGDFGRKIRMINAALGGMDSRWGLANIRKRVVSESPDTVFIEFAVNDALESSKLSVEESRWNLEKMIGIIREARPDCQVILMIMNPPTGKPLAERPGIRRYEEMYRQVAQHNSCPLLDFSRRWRSIIAREPGLWHEYAPDGLHPNAQASSDVILPLMLKQLGLTEKSIGDINKS